MYKYHNRFTKIKYQTKLGKYLGTMFAVFQRPECPNELDWQKYWIYNSIHTSILVMIEGRHVFVQHLQIVSSVSLSVVSLEYRVTAGALSGTQTQTSWAIYVLETRAGTLRGYQQKLNPCLMCLDSYLVYWYPSGNTYPIRT